MAIHVAILRRGYLRLILAGHKTIESRLTKTARVPYRQIEPGEVIYFKCSGGPFMATATARAIRFYEDLTPGGVLDLQQRYNHAIRGEPAYWLQKRHSRYATLVTLGGVRACATGPAIPPSHGIAWFRLDPRK